MAALTVKHVLSARESSKHLVHVMVLNFTHEKIDLLKETLLSKGEQFSECLIAAINTLSYTAVCETGGLARSINTQPALRRSEPSMSSL
jgi:hypothetical protein